MTKRCTRCKKDKPKTDFGPRKRSKDGLTPWCRPCRNEYQQNREAKMKEQGICLNDYEFGKWIRSYRLKLGMNTEQAEKLARLPNYRLGEIENGTGYGITRREVVALSVLYKLDAGTIEQKAVGAS